MDQKKWFKGHWTSVTLFLLPNSCELQPCFILISRWTVTKRAVLVSRLAMENTVIPLSIVFQHVPAHLRKRAFLSSPLKKRLQLQSPLPESTPTCSLAGMTNWWWLLPLLPCGLQFLNITVSSCPPEPAESATGVGFCFRIKIIVAFVKFGPVRLSMSVAEVAQNFCQSWSKSMHQQIIGLQSSSTKLLKLWPHWYNLLPL